MKPKKLTDLEIAIKLEEIEAEETIKQTVVEYLFQELWDTPKDKFVWQSILKQAKEYEKNQIIHAFASGWLTEPNVHIGKEMQNYYKNKFKNK
jgi:hypothetical protein